MADPSQVSLFGEEQPPPEKPRKAPTRKLQVVQETHGEEGFTGLLFDMAKHGRETRHFATPGAKCSDWMIPDADPVTEGWTCPLVSCPRHMFALVNADKRRTSDQMVEILDAMPFHCMVHASRFAAVMGGLSDERCGDVFRVGRSAFNEELMAIFKKKRVRDALRPFLTHGS